MAALQDTPVSTVPVAPLGVLTATDFHAVPRSASAIGTELNVEVPLLVSTARHAVGDVARPLEENLAGLGELARGEERRGDERGSMDVDASI